MKLDKITVVCTGNICRSPMAEALLKFYLPNKEIHSAGIEVELNELEGQSASENAQQVLLSNGLDIRTHKAAQLTDEMVEATDLILVMTQEHMDQIAFQFPRSVNKTFLLGQWIGVGCIKDPMNQDLPTFENCYQQLKQATVSWSSKLHSVA